MDFTRFINSKDIRNHLKEMNYPFTALEAAYLVYRSLDATMEERFAAWREIIQTMPDCSMDDRPNMSAIDSFHGFLRAYMELQEKSLERFQNGDGFLYTYSHYECGEPEGRWFDSGEWFSAFEPCMEQCRRELGDGSFDGLKIQKYKLDRAVEDQSRRDASMYLNEQFEILSCDLTQYTEEEFDLYTAFDGMWFSFPTPFQRGDILKCADPTSTGNPFVLDHLCTWDAESMLKNGFSPTDRVVRSADRILGKLRKDGDSTDMTALGYAYLPSQVFWYDHQIHNYLELEYLREPLSGTDRVLKPVSEFLKGNCGLELLLNGCQLILSQANCGELEERCRHCYTQEGRELIGLAN